MKTPTSLIVYTLIFLLYNQKISCPDAYSSDKGTVYRGSTPAHADVRDFLGIPREDSIDFIRWTLLMHPDHFELDCRYGVGRPGTNGFIHEKKQAFSGRLTKQDNNYQLERGNNRLFLLEVNTNLLYLLDKNKNMLVGTGGFSYVLNQEAPQETDAFHVAYRQLPDEDSLIFQGRTPCRVLSAILDPAKAGACEKIKWYITLYLDPVAKRPAYYLKGPRSFKKEARYRNTWEIQRGKDGRVIYKLETENRNAPIYLLSADGNILFFTDREGKLLVGDENFSYVLNRTKQ